MSLSIDISVFEALFQVNYKPMVATAYRIVQDKDIAEDIVQDVFIGFWKKRNTISIKTSVKAYLFQNVINQSLNYIKKIKNVAAREELFNAEIEVDYLFTEYPLTLEETGKRIEDAISLLPAACRTIFVLSRHEQLSYKEIARKLEIPEKTVEGQMSKALKHLSKCLLY